jgi:radical SAM superfamily enzyme YgiQ (UPF0313 family)
MKILLVFPKVKYSPSPIKNDREVYKKLFGESISLTLPQVAASTPNEHTVEIIDENYDKLNFDCKVDLVGITCLTMTANRAYEIADIFRNIGIPVILGGNHPTSVPEEAKNHADSVVVGEAEIVWPKLLLDFKKGELKEFYIADKTISPGMIPEPRRDLLKKRYSSDGLLIKRGCPNRCEFCTISQFYGKGVRPIENVISEINKINSKTIFIYDSNLTWNMNYTKNFLRKIQDVNKNWLANATPNVLLKDDEFLKLAKDANFFCWLIGFESISQRSLDGISKKHNKVEDYISTIRKIKSYGMVIVGTFIFGFDEDTPDIFDETLKTINDLEIDMAEFHILTPFPGTVLYERLKKEGRLLTADWSKYTTTNVVFEPKNMTIEELFNGTRKVAREFHSLMKIFERFYKSLELTKSIFVSNYVLQRNLRYRERYKNQFNF